MILIGQYDSPFVRRVAIAMQLYSIAYSHRTWSVFGNAKELGEVNPLLRVPTLVLDDGVALTDSAAIIDWLDHEVGVKRAMFPPTGDARRNAMRVTAYVCGLGDKAVALFYERALHDVASDIWTKRCQVQMSGTLKLLEAERAAQLTPYWGGDTLGHADVATACMLRFIFEAHPGVIDPAAIPALSALSDRCEAMEVFRRISQPFVFSG